MNAIVRLPFLFLALAAACSNVRPDLEATKEPRKEELASIRDAAAMETDDRMARAERLLAGARPIASDDETDMNAACGAKEASLGDAIGERVGDGVVAVKTFVSRAMELAREGLDFPVESRTVESRPPDSVLRFSRSEMLLPVRRCL